MLLTALFLCVQLHVPGDFVHLRDAVRAAPAGGTVIVHGGVHPSLVFDRPITLVGSPRATIEGAAEFFGSYGEAITLYGPGPVKGDVTLINLRIGTRGAGTVLPSEPASIYAYALWLRQLRVIDCDVRGAAYPPGITARFPVGLGSRPGIVLGWPALLWLERSFVGASDSGTGDVAGGYAVLAPGSVVLALGSHLAGGDAAHALVGQGGRLSSGGGAIVCGELYEHASRFELGDGAPGSSVQRVEAPRRQALAGGLALAGGTLGGELVLTVEPRAWLLVCASRSLRAPSSLGGDPWFLEAPLLLQRWTRGPTEVRYKIPPKLYLAGRVIAFQAIDFTHGRLTNPVSAALTP